MNTEVKKGRIRMKIELLQALRNQMQQDNVQAVIIPTSDFHDTEYVCAHFQARAAFSGFTGSAGTLVVLTNKAALWTDGRYFVQATKELKGSGIELMKAGLKTTPSIEQWICQNLEKGQTVAVDGRCISYNDFIKYNNDFDQAGLVLKIDKDFPGAVWKDRPSLPCTSTFPYNEQYSGESTASKIQRVRHEMKKKQVDHFITTKIDDIGWLLNLRANDIPHFPEALSYLILSEESGTLYINESRLDEVSRQLLEEVNIQVQPYESFYEAVKTLQGKTLTDPSLTNALACLLLKEPVLETDPVILMKAIKNSVEQEGFRQAHIKDGIAVTRFMKWFKEHVGKEEMTEISAQEVLHDFRAQNPDFLEESFSTISAYGSNAAMPHYHADEITPVPVKAKGLFLVDSGGHYLEGTTDVTRTFVAGPLTEKEKYYFTKVLQGHIRLSKAVFPYGVRGMNLDILARGPLWEDGMDYNHGTGHGVGALSNVHEAPNGIRWKIVPERNDSGILEPGMITSNEPGMYVEGQFGIRHENLILCVEKCETEYGRFLTHEPLTVVPFDLDGIDPSQLQKDEIHWLNQYHQRVYERLSPYFNDEEKVWLSHACRSID